ncbi:hypothetical protein AXG93_903s1030 [Marchantia polymorpha subsp. ruderalis]|uniref:Protein kinase domain-containing protein n=1 Tax=Marchantia polymorpha subsp. ruderalis TaxID=1480154 RepID=A0A176W127_MARPO|nr:hypothetical protein AXG93_903s1030 [Marchantia polymorpha subsp. ruderalis]
MPRSLFAPPLIPVAPDFECHHDHTSAEPANCVASQESDKPSSRTSSPEPLIEQIIAILGPWIYQELSEATGGFDLRNKLGAGGFGSVYRGVLPGTGTVVAIKTMDEGSDQGVKEFLAEVRTISRVRHRNVVQLLGWCGREHHFMLVYEYMPNGSLDKALFRRPTCRLSWRQRFKIIFGIAAALDHLHEGWRHKVIHRDVKSSNIMLDAHFCAKLGDFGLARMNPHQMSLATTNPAGTFGYLAPESAIFGKFTVKSDVFAFGAVVLEIACGRGALEPLLPNEQSVLKDWVDKAFKEGQLMRVADPRLQGQFNFGQMQAVLLLGLVCSASNPNDRPSMRQVLQVLAGETPMLPVSVCKPAKGREERRAPSSVAGPLTICSTPCT